MNKVAFVYPGQGSQYPQMGKEIYDHIPEAKEVILHANDVLKQDFEQLIFQGTKEQLTQTENAQLAIFITSLMIQKAVESVTHKKIDQLCHAVLGHSLGEYSALAASKALDIIDGLKLIKIRSNAMQKALPLGTSTMAAIIGLDIQKVDEIIAQFQDPFGLCVIANDNSPEQIVISGHTESVEEVMHLAKEKGAKRAVSLNVSAAFHSSLMKNAQDMMRFPLVHTVFSHPIVPLMWNVNAMYLQDVQEIPRILLAQITERIRFRECILKLHKDGFNTFVEIGPSKVLTGLVKRTIPTATLYNVENLDTLHKFADSFS